MAQNLGATTLRRKRRQANAMRDFDRLPPVLREWLAEALLPWRPGSAERLFERALAETGDPDRALARLEAIQQDMVARDAAAIWGSAHPAAEAIDKSASSLIRRRQPA